MRITPFWCMVRVSQGFLGTREHWQNTEGNKGTLANFWEQGNKIRKKKLQYENILKTLRKCVGTWEHRAILEGNKGTRTPPGRTLHGRHIEQGWVELGPKLGDLALLSWWRTSVKKQNVVRSFRIYFSNSYQYCIDIFRNLERKYM